MLKLVLTVWVLCAEQLRTYTSRPRLAAIPDLQFSKTKFEKKVAAIFSHRNRIHISQTNFEKKSSIENFATEIEMN